MSWFDDNLPQITDGADPNTGAGGFQDWMRNERDLNGRASPSPRILNDAFPTAGRQSSPLLGGSPQGNEWTRTAAGGGGDIQAFIQQWQQTHNPTEGIGGLADALSQGGYGGVSRYMYGNTPSNNELSLNGEKYKVLGGEGTSGAYWYKPGMDDSPGGGGMNYGASGSLLTPWTQQFQRRSPEDIANDPAFKFQLEQGMKAVQGGAAARGTLLTGGTQKDLAAYGQGLASTFDDKFYGRDRDEYLLGRENFYNNQDRPYSKLLGVAGLGKPTSAA